MHVTGYALRHGDPPNFLWGKYLQCIKVKKQLNNFSLKFLYSMFAVAVGSFKNGKKESKWRFDRRCGPNYPLSDGGPSQCNPTSKNYCCSKWGWCGAQGDTPGDNDTDHCTGGIDYRIKDE